MGKVKLLNHKSEQLNSSKTETVETDKTQKEKEPVFNERSPGYRAIAAICHEEDGAITCY